jgi:hypothetical protein
MIITGWYSAGGQNLPTFTYHSIDTKNKRFIDFWNDSKSYSNGAEPNFVGINFDKQ